MRRGKKDQPKQDKKTALKESFLRRGEEGTSTVHWSKKKKTLAADARESLAGVQSIGETNRKL